MNPSPFARRPGIDCIRGAAVVAMIAFHVTVDLRLWDRYPSSTILNLPGWYWEHGSDPIGACFFLLVGYSAALRTRAHGVISTARALRRRGLFLLLIAGALSAGTYWFTPDLFIAFGVLHAIGVTSLLLPWFLSRPKLAAGIGALATAAGIYLQGRLFPFSGLLWLGFRPLNGIGGDWYPLLPWTGVALLGLAYALLFPRNTPAPRSVSPIMQPLAWAGRHSLAIYLVHQPILLGLFYVLGMKFTF